MTTVGDALQQARQLVSAGQLVPAEALYCQLVQLVPQAGELWAELGYVRLKMRSFETAVECLQKAVDLAGGNAAYHSNLGTAYRMVKRNDLAIECYERAMRLEAPTAEMYNNLALAFKESRQFDAALQALDTALQIRPDYINGLLNRGNLLRDLGRLDEATETYQKLLELKPDVGAYIGLGIVQHDLGNFDAALRAYERALEVQPNYPDARRNRAVIWLGRGDYENGWAEYEWRLECEDSEAPKLPQPRWDGSPLNGRSLLVYAEQGFGDVLNFIRYVPMAEQTGGTVWADVPRPLVPLLTQSGFGQHLVVGPTLPAFDVQCALLSLPGLLPGRTQPTWPGPYLSADPELVARWRQPLENIRGFKVGIVWAGNPRHPHDRYRSTRLQQFAPLAAIDGVRLISLQKDCRRAEDAEAAARLQIINLEQLDETGGAFMDTAAVMQHLDLVITVDTSVAHVAGGLGVSVWVALEYSPDWRWHTEGQTTAWYPSMRLFRQRALDDWTPVFTDMANALRVVARARSSAH